ncbi:ribonuclease H-like domain-containing protein [Fomes fomentarius]|nr:ribonuclease H-like domain-containing protein [Fomes fomentarius]
MTKIFYAVARGRKPGVYLEWKDCAAQVLNFYGAKYKKFPSAADAELWISENARPEISSDSTTRSPTSPSNDTVTSSASPVIPGSSPESMAVSQLQARNAHTASPPIRTQPTVRTSTVTNTAMGVTTSSNVQTKERIASPPRPPLPGVSSPTATGGSGLTSLEPIVVYTDGSCRGNGKEGSTAGVGVWWGRDDPRNVSARCPGDQTNNRAELIAIIRVLETAPKDRPLEIRSDSEYSINSMNKWLPSWKKNGWRKPDGKLVKNADLIQYADLLLEERRSGLKQSVVFTKVLAHSGIEGNEAADRLANEGATLPPTLDPDWHKLMDEVGERIRHLRSSSSLATAVKTVTVSRTIPKQSTSSPATQPVAAVPCPMTKPALLPVPVSRESSSSGSSQVVSAVTHRTSSSTTSLVPTAEELHNPGVLHGDPDLRITPRELKAYAECYLPDDDFLREAQEAGVWTKARV